MCTVGVYLSCFFALEGCCEDNMGEGGGFGDDGGGGVGVCVYYCCYGCAVGGELGGEERKEWEVGRERRDRLGLVGWFD